MTPGKVYGALKLEKKFLENRWFCLKKRQFENKNPPKFKNDFKNCSKKLKIFTGKWGAILVRYKGPG